jgi:D-serine deaminase-like pyridoxal phosphate-dependent protein
MGVMGKTRGEERWLAGRPWNLVEEPTLILDTRRAVANIESMVRKAERSQVRLRPHFKTHQSAEIGEWFRDRGVTAITVSSVAMASYFVSHQWHDITIAFTVNLRQIEGLRHLCQRADIGLLLESAESVCHVAAKLNAEARAWIKIDTGYHRTGIAWDDSESCLSVARAIEQSPNLELAGLLTHAGQTYSASSSDQIRDIFHQTTERMNQTRRRLAPIGKSICLSVGDTPGCSLVDDFDQVDEVRPGNFVFYDLMQWRLRSCSEEQIALAVACPVVAKHDDRHEIVIYGGAVHLSKEFVYDAAGRKIYGGVALPAESGWTGMRSGSYLAALSQEHGIVRADEELFAKIQIGDLLVIIPVHSCLTANLLREYLTLDGRRMTLG